MKVIEATHTVTSDTWTVKQEDLGECKDMCDKCIDVNFYDYLQDDNFFIYISI